MSSKHHTENRTLLIAAPFKGDALSLEKVFAGQYTTKAMQSLASLSQAIGEQTGLIVITEEALVTDVTCFGQALDHQPGRKSRSSCWRQAKAVRVAIPTWPGAVFLSLPATL